MTTHDFLALLWRITLSGSVAIGLVLALRVLVRHWLGAQAAYLCWLLVPCAMIALLLPAPARPLLAVMQLAPAFVSDAAVVVLPAAASTSFDPQPWLFGLWIAGALALLAVLVTQQVRYLRALGRLSPADDGALRAHGALGSPALVGALRPRIVLPSDFDTRFTPRERELVLAHERAHLARGDAQTNVLVALLRCLNWFNPLFHFAASRFRFDQELACDALVVLRFPEARRPYADAMLKAQLVGEARQELRLPAGCYWPSSHPLKARIAMLKAPVPSRRRRIFSSAIVLTLTLGAGYASWAAQPAQVVRLKAAGAVATDEPIMVNLAISVDGRGVDAAWKSETSTDGCMDHDSKSNLWTICAAAGKAFALNLTRAGERWGFDAIPTPLPDGSIDLSGFVKHNDEIVSAPRLIVRDGEPAAIQLGEQRADGGFQGLRVDLILARHAAQAGAEQKPQAGVIMLGELKTIASFADKGPSENITFRRMKPPQYPPLAVKTGVGAKVILKVLIDEQGQPKSADVEKLELVGEPKSLTDGSIVDIADIKGAFTKASLEAVLSWTYNPGMKDGKPFAGYGLVPIDFSLHDCDKDHPCPPPGEPAAKS